MIELTSAQRRVLVILAQPYAYLGYFHKTGWWLLSRQANDNDGAPRARRDVVRHLKNKGYIRECTLAEKSAPFFVEWVISDAGRAVLQDRSTVLLH